MTTQSRDDHELTSFETCPGLPFRELWAFNSNGALLFEIQNDGLVRLVHYQ